MVAAAVFAYFLIVVFGVLLVVFPGCRERVAAALSGAFTTGVLPLLRIGVRVSSGFHLFIRSIKQSLEGGGRFLSANPLLAGGALLLVVAPTLIALSIHTPAIFDFSNDTRLVDRQISVLLDGEQLIPPPPLPPEVFTTSEVEQVRPDVVHASRNWSFLDQDFKQRLLVVFKLMNERHGYDMVLIEGYRSPERQARLYEQGSHVTQAGANMSYHQYGLAADSAFFRDGKLVISERDPWAMRGYQLYGEIAQQVGLTWGGGWKMQDYGHVELRRAGVLGRAAAQ
ncbi:M15 family metallopeptidase [Dechloromonas sp. XY25]|uniref:M15 family metallopeptidase n=1 Tax=Dechloromonas hankyongensis TaxID=2908002 RepID=A0ABS9K3N0_9RHOO|nr:M15 family metallopeptidase [Dechloromonas hankyongensis]MCG2577674.1 M15 family metallopeptidase [Dechloromonas hankyongensis]